MIITQNKKVQVIIWTVLFVAMLLLSRFAFLQGDDFLHTSITPQPYGRFNISAWFHEWKIDYTLRNGRTADALARLWLRPGIKGARLILSIVLTTFFFASFQLLNSLRKVKLNTINYITSLSALLAIFSLVLFTDQQYYANVIGWISGSANYLLPTALLLVGIRPSYLWLMGLNLSYLQVALSIMSIILAQISHEQHELSVLIYWFAFIVIVLIKKLGLPTIFKVQIIVSFIVGFIHLLAPGIWIRLNVVSLASAEVNGFQKYLLNFSTAVQGFLWFQRYLFLLLLPLVLWLIRRSPSNNGIIRNKLSLITILIFGGNWLLVVLRRNNNMHNIRGGLHELSPALVYYTAAMSILGLIALASLIIYLLASDTNMKIRTGVLWIVLIIGNTIILLLIGSMNIRSYFPGTIYLGALILHVFFALLDERRQSVKQLSLVAISGIALLFTLFVFTRTGYMAYENRKVWDQIEGQLKEAQIERPAVIEIKDRSFYPYPQSMYYRAFKLESYEVAIRHYYNVPEFIELEQGK